MPAAKGLKRLLAYQKVMAGYDGASGYSLGLLRTGMHALVGALSAAAVVGLEARMQPALGQEVARIAYQQTNLASFGVPDVAGLKPYHTRMLDLTEKVPGAETRLDMYQVAGGAVVGVYSISNKVFGILYDPDGRPPLEHAFFDMQGKGLFESVDPKGKYPVPEWVIRDVVSASNLKQ